MKESEAYLDLIWGCWTSKCHYAGTVEEALWWTMECVSTWWAQNELEIGRGTKQASLATPKNCLPKTAFQGQLPTWKELARRTLERTLLMVPLPSDSDDLRTTVWTHRPLLIILQSKTSILSLISNAHIYNKLQFVLFKIQNHFLLQIIFLECFSNLDVFCVWGLIFSLTYSSLSS